VFWIVGKYGVLSGAFQRRFLARDRAFYVSSRQECDIQDLASVKAFIQGKSIQYIINCSGYTAVDAAEKHKEEAYAINAQGIKHLAVAAQEIGAKLIHFSTDYVFNGKQKAPYIETDSPAPLNVYGASKWAGEKILTSEYPEALVIRISWLFSEEGPSFMQAMWRAFLEKEEVHVVSTQVGKPTYAEDVVLAVQEMLPYEGLYHFANRDEVSRYTYAQEIFTELKRQGATLKCERILPTEHVSQGAVRPAYSALSTEKIEKILSQPIRSHKAALRECITYRLKKENIGAR